MTSASDLRKNATISAAGSLPGGSDTNVKPTDTSTNVDIPVRTQEDIYAEFVVDQEINPDVQGLEYTPLAGGDAKPPLILTTEKETIKLGEALKRFEDSF